MQIEHNIPQINDQKTIKDFIPLVFGFFGGLIALSIYQNLRLYFSGVLDSFLNKSFLLLLLHHTGYTAIVTLVLVFLFNYLELKKANKGFRVVRSILFVLLGIEGLLVAYYVQNYEILGADVFSISEAENIRFFMLPIVLMLLLTALIFHYTQKATANLYKIISRMYPFTIIVFSLFLATLNADKKPVNENKTQHLFQSIALNLFEFNSYDGAAEFPLLQQYKQDDALGSYFNLGDEKPNIVILVIEGMGVDFMGKNARFKGFTPGLDSLTAHSLVWNNFLSNTGTSFASLPMITGSLPFGENGFSNIETYTDRNTLYSILKENGYQTSFNYGGNSALNHIDRFLDQERVDQIIDKKSFGADFQLQEEDAAGISLGYPDKQLFNKWNSKSVLTDQPKLDVFLTLSSKNPYLIPEQEKYETKVDLIISKASVSKQSKRIINTNKDAFTSIVYADEAVSSFISSFKTTSTYNNTIFIITGSHNLTDLPQTNELSRYQVPFMIHSPLLKSYGSINTLASHADITPSLIALLDAKFNLKVPQQTAWLGNSLIASNTFNNTKQIPLLRDNNNIQDFIQGNHYLSSGAIFRLNEDLEVLEAESDFDDTNLKQSFNAFKAINTYVTLHNKLIPPSNQSLSAQNNFTKTERIWIESVFNGNDVDNAYNTARKLAFDKDWDRSLLLSKYILSKTPRHADTEILMGRVYSWQKDFSASEKILKEAIRKYPKYSDGYAALLDTYFWAETNEKALVLFKTIEGNEVHSSQITEKIKRAKEHISEDSTLDTNIVIANEFE